MQQRVSTLLFDLGGVILNLDYSLTIKAFQELGGRDFQVRYSQAMQLSLFDDFEVGAIDEHEFREGIRAIIGQDVEDEKIDHAWNAMLLDLPVARISLLKSLRNKYQLLLFSNTNAIHLKQFRKSLGHEHGDELLLENLFDQTYYSHEIGQRKPNIAAFQTILANHNLKPSSVAFIDDSLQHIEGATKAGIIAYHHTDGDLVNLCNLHF